MSPYQKLLQDPRWQKKRLERLEASDWMCENCGAKDKTLHVHHPVYKSGHKPWEYECDELGVLCDACHKKEHQIETVLKRHLASNSDSRSGLLAIVTGYLEANFALSKEDEEILFDAACPIMRRVGVVAESLSLLSRKDFRRITTLIYEARNASALSLSPVERDMIEYAAECD